MPEKPSDDIIDDTVIVPKEEPEDDTPAGPYNPGGPLWRRGPRGGYIPGRNPVPGNRVPPPGGMYMGTSFNGPFPPVSGDISEDEVEEVPQPGHPVRRRVPRIPNRPEKSPWKMPGRVGVRSPNVRVESGWAYGQKLDLT